MDHDKNPSFPAADAQPRDTDARPAYERPRVVKKKSVTRATLFTGGGPGGGPPLVGNG